MPFFLPIMDMDTQLAWLAGIIEGEGCISIKSRPNQKNALMVRVKMTDEDIIQRVANLFGTSYRSVAPAQAHWKTQYSTEITGKRAANLMKMISPLLGRRRKERLASLL